MPAPSHTWFHAMAAVPTARLSVILRGVFVPSVLKRGGKCAPDPTPSAPPAPADTPGPIRIRAMPFRCCAKGSHGRAGAALSGAKGSASVLVRLSFQPRRTRRSTENHEGLPDMSAWRPCRRCQDISGASRAAPSRSGSSLSRSGCGGEVCQCPHRPCLVPVNEGHLYNIVGLRQNGCQTVMGPACPSHDVEATGVAMLGLI